MPARMAMMAMTTRSSIRVKARRRGWKGLERRSYLLVGGVEWRGTWGDVGRGGMWAWGGNVVGGGVRGQGGGEGREEGAGVFFRD